MACSCSSVKISKMRHKVELYREDKASDGSGGYIRTWLKTGNMYVELIEVLL